MSLLIVIESYFITYKNIQNETEINYSIPNPVFSIRRNIRFRATAQDNKMPDISSWPKASQMAAKMMMEKYGKPNETTQSMLVWYNNGTWKRTTIFNYEMPHHFPY